MRYLFFTLILLFSLTGCQDKEQQAKHDAKVAQQAKKELLAEIKAKEEARIKAIEEAQKDSRLSKAGITIDDGKIIIDTNKTKDFFENMAQNIDTKFKKVTIDIKKGMLDDDEMGISIDEGHINIDLNKTKGFFETLGKKIQDFMKEFDAMIKEIDIQAEEKQDANQSIKIQYN